MARRRWPLAIPGPISCQHTLPPATTGQCGLANNISFTNLCTLSTCHRSEHALLGGYKQFILGRATDKRSPSKSKVRMTFSRRLQRSQEKLVRSYFCTTEPLYLCHKTYLPCIIFGAGTWNSKIPLLAIPDDLSNGQSSMERLATFGNLKSPASQGLDWSGKLLVNLVSSGRYVCLAGYILARPDISLLIGTILQEKLG